ELALLVHTGRAYQRGFEFTLALHMRTRRERLGDDPMAGWHGPRHGKFDDDVLRFGIEFADGRKATIFDPHPWWGDPERVTTPEIVLMQRGGGGGGTSWDFRFWTWPLPPKGPLDFVTEWPSEELSLTRVQLDSAVVREAAGRAEMLWPVDDGGGQARGWTRRYA
ncbi:MAG TPA: hypothetical protein VLJ44_11650, partial [Gaiellaceae bacterium]|nr:hypothetical protein [Gaiellaceae bacterium]